MLRPLPNLDDETVMAKLGRLSALRSARMDAAHDLRDIVSRILSGNDYEDKDLAAARACLDRLEEIRGIEKYV